MRRLLDLIRGNATTRTADIDAPSPLDRDDPSRGESGRAADGRSPLDPVLIGLLDRLHLELVPMRSIGAAADALPARSHVSVTCSTTAGLRATREQTERLVAAGHQVTPHVAARLVTDRSQTRELAAWTRSLGLRELFVIAGDAPDAAGPYHGALAFLCDLLDADPGVERIGVTGYPDGHALIDDAVLDEQLVAKQTLLDESGVDGWISTQMCFDAETITSWIDHVRSGGVHLPIRLGIPGAVDRTRLMTMGVRLGVGASLRYLTKNASTVGRLVAPGGYDPCDLLDDLAPDLPELDVEALHVFTFNSVADTVAWRDRALGDAAA